MKKLLTFGLAVAVITVGLFNAGTLAQTTEEDDIEARGGSGFRISPVRQDLVLERGESATRSISVRNVTSNDAEVRAVVEDFGPSGNESGSPQILSGDLAQENYPTSIKPFVSRIDNLTLAAGEEKEIDVTYTAPEDTAPGSYFGVIRILTDNEVGNFTGDAGVTLNASVGMIVLIDIPGETLDILNLEQATALQDGNAGSVFSSAPDSFMFRLNNQGNTFQAPFGRVAIKNWSGDVVYEYELNEEQPRGNILPDSIRRFEHELEGIGSFGRYKVEANISYGTGGNIISSTTTFWVIPWVTIGVISVAVIALAFIGTRGVKAYNQKIISASKGSRVKKK